jgi:hypothetical protein
MLLKSILLMLVCGVCASSSVALNEHAEQGTIGGIPQSFTLYPPRDKNTGKYDESRACFSFKLGTNKLPNSVDWELGYGFAQISNEDWLTINTGRPEQRSVLKVLGKHSWDDSFRVPALKPLPELMEGQRREITIDASAGTHAAWANSTTHFAKATVGNMYLMHVKDDEADFYVLFRVEKLEQGEHCTISWKRIPNPEP